MPTLLSHTGVNVRTLKPSNVALVSARISARSEEENEQISHPDPSPLTHVVLSQPLGMLLRKHTRLRVRTVPCSYVRTRPK